GAILKRKRARLLEVVSMAESFFETEAAVQAASGEQPQAAPAEPAGALAVSADEFAALEERIRRAVELVKRERQARVVAEERATKAEAQLFAQSPVVEQLKGE